MSVITRHTRIERAIRLISVGLRPNIVALDTGLSLQSLRDIYCEVQGVPAPPGQLPTAEGRLKTKLRYMEASALLGMYVKLAAKPMQEVDLDALITAHELRARLKPAEISINQAWVVARSLRARTILLVPCRRCRSPLIDTVTHRMRPDCPFCESGLLSPSRDPETAPATDRDIH